jgi:excisionase family DNA binding protein
MAATVQELNFLTVQETAALLRQSERSIRRKIAAGHIPAIRLTDGSGPLRIPLDRLLQWLYEPAESLAERHGSPNLPVSGAQSSPQAHGGDRAA